jgi:type IV fimbrial biogenesis protein FimT
MTRHGGFTVTELMITVAVIAALATIAAPSLRDLTRNARMTSLANDFMTDLSVARSEAIKRGVRTAICTSSNGTSCTNTGWNQGWIVFTDDIALGASGKVDAKDVILKVAPTIYGANETPPTLITDVNTPAASPGGKYVGFRPSGVTTPGGTGAGSTIEFHMCDSRTTDVVGAGAASLKGRLVTVTGTGRASVVRCTCPSSTSCVPPP